MMAMAHYYYYGARRPSLSTPPTALRLLFLFVFSLLLSSANAGVDNPKSKPYVAYRTDPYDQPAVTTWVLKDGVEKSPRSNNNNNASEGGIHKNEVNRRTSKNNRGGSNNNEEANQEDTRCPLSFRLGTTQHASSSHVATSGGGGARGGNIARSPPVIYPLHPDLDAGSGRQILLVTTWEMLEMWTPGGGSGGGSGASSSASSSEQLKEDEQFPLLFEGSSFYHTSPIVYDVAGDGIMDAILGDYDGEIHVIGLDFEQDASVVVGGGSGRQEQQQGNNKSSRRRRYYERISVPRLAVRKSWYDAAIGKTNEIFYNATTKSTTIESSGILLDPNRTREEFLDPYHTYFEQTNVDWRRSVVSEHNNDEEHPQPPQQPLRGVSADVLTMGMDSAKALADQRRRQGRRRTLEDTGAGGEEESDANNEGGAHRRLQEEDELDKVVANEQTDFTRDEPNEEERIKDGTLDGGDGDIVSAEMQAEDTIRDYQQDDGLFHDDARGAPPDGSENNMEESDFRRNWGDDVMMRNEGEGVEVGDNSLAGAMTGTDEIVHRGMDDYYPYGEHGYMDDGYIKPQAPEGWDTYDQYQEAKDAYFHNSNYLHIPPHLLSSCTVVELPREYVSASMKPADVIDELILCAVSYYFDEDEVQKTGWKRSFGKHANANGGDETEEQRGRYVANAILGYNLK
jgi:hypothetical protein